MVLLNQTLLHLYKLCFTLFNIFVALAVILGLKNILESSSIHKYGYSLTYFSKWLLNCECNLLATCKSNMFSSIKFSSGLIFDAL